MSYSKVYTNLENHIDKYKGYIVGVLKEDGKNEDSVTKIELRRNPNKELILHIYRLDGGTIDSFVCMEVK